VNLFPIPCVAAVVRRLASGVATAATLLFLAAASPLIVAADTPLSWGDQGDGTYRNPY